jgi:hypothetical protein
LYVFAFSFSLTALVFGDVLFFGLIPQE